jgi:hypothetical protein
MTEMPTCENPIQEDAIRALELAYSYFAMPRLVPNPVALASYTERGAIGHAMNPIVGTPKGQLDNLCRGAVDNLRVKPASDASAVEGARRLRATLRAFAGMPKEKARKLASERKARPTHYQIALENKDAGVFTLGGTYSRKDDALRKARWFSEIRNNVEDPILGTCVRAFYRDGTSKVIHATGTLHARS